MAKARATGSGTILFGLLRVPFKTYTAATPEKVLLNQLHKGCGSRLKQQLVCEREGVVVAREDLAKGFEHQAGQWLTFTDAELEQLDAAQDNVIELSRFVPEKTVDLRHVESTQFIGPDKGSEWGYSLLALTLQSMGSVGVGKHYARGRDQLTVVRPFLDGLILHRVYYATEMRDFEDVELGKPVAVSDADLRLAEKILRANREPAFDPASYADEYRARLEAAIQAKVEGKQLVVLPNEPAPQLIDQREALKRSLDDIKGTLRKGRAATAAQRAG